MKKKEVWGIAPARVRGGSPGRKPTLVFFLTLLLTLLGMLLPPLPALALEKPKDWVPPPIEKIPNHREAARAIVVELSSYAKKRNKNFLVLIRNSVELVVKGEREVQWEDFRDPQGLTFEKRLPLGTVFRPYMKALDGIILDNIYCGPDAFGIPLAKAIEDRKTYDRILAEEKAKGIQRPPVPNPYGPFSLDPAEELRRAAELRHKAQREERQRRQLYAIDALQGMGRPLFSMEQCATPDDAKKAAVESDVDGVLSFITTDRSGKFNLLPAGRPRYENAKTTTTLGAVRNWLPMLRSDSFTTRPEWVSALSRTNQDLLLIDVSHGGTDPLTKEDIHRLKFKELGVPRLVLAVLPVGKAYDWRWYWQKDWQAGSPPFLFAPVPEDPGSFITDISDPKWKELVGKYLAGIVDLGFDGVVLDDMDTYLWFEELMPLEG